MVRAQGHQKTRLSSTTNGKQRVSNSSALRVFPFSAWDYLLWWLLAESSMSINIPLRVWSHICFWSWEQILYKHGGSAPTVFVHLFGQLWSNITQNNMALHTCWIFFLPIYFFQISYSQWDGVENLRVWIFYNNIEKISDFSKHFTV